MARDFFSLLQIIHTVSGIHPATYYMGTGQRGWDMMLTINPHLALRLRINKAMPLFSLYACMA
jgi:hypothetical protein